MDVEWVLRDLGVTGAAYAAPIAGGSGIGVYEDELVVPASIMKVQVALAALGCIEGGELDGSALRSVPTGTRTPGPTGMSLMHDRVLTSARDLVVAMLTISDNVATDELIAIVGLDRINRTVGELGLTRTVITTDLRTMLDAIAGELGFGGFDALVAHDPSIDGRPTESEIATGIFASAPLDPVRGTRTTARETVMLLQAIWTDRAGDPEACRKVRDTMARQLTQTRIAAGFDESVTVAAKSGALLGVVRNEAGVVTLADGFQAGVAVFTRRAPGVRVEKRRIDAAIGEVARQLVTTLHGA